MLASNVQRMLHTAFTVGTRHYFAGDPIFKSAELTQQWSLSGSASMQKPLGEYPAMDSLGTVIRLDCLPIPEHWPQSLLQRWQAEDDVFAPEFLQRIIVAHCLSASEGNITSMVEARLSEHNATRGIPLTLVRDPNLEEGPYLWMQDHLIPVWRIYSDSQEAFALATVPNLDPHQS